MATKGQFLEDAGPRGAMTGNAGRTGDELDAARKRNMAYEYLCHLEEARKWLEACLQTDMPPASELEGALRNGVIVAKLSRFFKAEAVKKIYDEEEKVYQDRGLVFRHTDNINQWLNAMKSVKFPEIFYPEITDLYDKKNMPRVIYCVHALSRYLYHLGIAPEMEDLHGVAEFTEEELSAMEQELHKAGVQMPSFGKIGGVLAKELGTDEASMHAAILKINQALEAEEPQEQIVKLMKNPLTQLKNVTPENGERYRDTLIAAKMEKTANAPERSHAEESASSSENKEVDIYDTNLTREEIQKSLNVINAAAAAERKQAAIGEAIEALSNAVDERDEGKVMECLQAPVLEIEGLDDSAGAFYVSELATLQDSLPEEEFFTVPQVQDAVDQANAKAENERKVNEALAKIKEPAQGDDAQALLQELKAASALLGLPDLTDSDEAAAKYQESVRAKIAAGDLDVAALRQVIADANAQLDKEAIFNAALKSVNECIDRGVAEDTLGAMKHEALNLQEVDDVGAAQYQALLAERKQAKGDNLTRDELQKAVNDANFQAEQDAKHAAAIFALNVAVRAGDEDRTLECLQNPDTRLEGVQENCKTRYQDALSASSRHKERNVGSHPSRWKTYKTDDGRTYFYNKETKETQWVPPVEVNPADLTLEEVQPIVKKCNEEQARWDSFVAASPSIVAAQSLIRGAQARRKFRERKAYLEGHEAEAVKIQAAVRGMQQRKRYKDRLAYLNAQTDAAVKIQAAWKGKKARDAYENLTTVTNPPVNTVRRFLHLLDQSDADFAEELNMQQLKQRVVLAIQSNHTLEGELDKMDIKIGLLVRNRIGLEDVERQNRELKRARKKGSSAQLDMQHEGGLNELRKDVRERLESFQHLFYLLQTQPRYLARLVFLDSPLERWSKNHSDNFIKHALQLIYNYASNAREEYLLLKLFRKALHTEITEKVDTIKDITTSQPLVIKLTVNQYRTATSSDSYFKTVFGPVIRQIMEDRNLDLSTNPVDIYHRWINRQEAETGQASSLPYDVSAEEALKNPEVAKETQAAVRKMIEYCTLFLRAITNNVNAVPYGLRYICNALQYDLRQKFPKASDDEVIKAVGNVIYYRYINPVISTPEMAGLLQDGEKLEMTERRNLASISKVLQFAAAGQQQDGDEELRQFGADAWRAFRSYFIKCATVESSEKHFNIDEYSDVSMVTKPQITISMADMYYLHEMLATNIDQIATDEKDHLRDVLQDLGEVGTEREVLGEDDSPQLASSKVPMVLTLTNKYEVPADDDSNIKALFVRTKRMVVDVIRFQHGKDLKAILETPAPAEAEKQHKEHYDKHKKELEEKAAKEGAKASNLLKQVPPFKTLEQTKAKILANAQALEKEGLCTQADGYQGLLNAVAQDIRNQRIYRKQRKTEIQKLTHALSELESKKQFHISQTDYYDKYVASCVGQIGKSGAKRSRLASFLGGKKKGPTSEGGQYMGSFKYSGAKLKEKGVLHSIDGVSDSKLKLVKIEISSEEVGVFVFRASDVLGTQGEEKELLFQDLLQMQYENVKTMKLFGVATINVNLLIFLINKKFLNK